MQQIHNYILKYNTKNQNQHLEHKKYTDKFKNIKIGNNFTKTLAISITCVIYI